MFDQTIFLRRYVLGDVPKVLLFAVMALGIRWVVIYTVLIGY